MGCQAGRPQRPSPPPHHLTLLFFRVLSASQAETLTSLPRVSFWAPSWSVFGPLSQGILCGSGLLCHSDCSPGGWVGGYLCACPHSRSCVDLSGSF